MAPVIQADLAVTTALKQTPELETRAQAIAAALNCPYVPRNDRSALALLQTWSVTGLLVVSAGKLSYTSGKGDEFFFHPGLSGIRINRLSSGQPDQMIAAMSLQPGDRVLDCTLGLGTDAIVASYVAGTAGRVVGLENSPALAYLVKTGLSDYPAATPDLTAAMRRVQVVTGEHLDYLQELAPRSFDVVYFDPMFRHPKLRSTSINALRHLADPAPVKNLALQEAVRVASKRVVLKERRGSPEFGRLGFTEIHGGLYAPIKYGVINCYD